MPEQRSSSVADATEAFWPKPRPRAFFLGVLLWVALSLVLSVLLAPLIHGAVDALFPGAIHFRRVVRRIGQLVALVLAIVGLRRLGVRRFADVGLAWMEGTRRGLAVTAGLGFALVAVPLGIEFALAGRRVTGRLGISELLLVLAGAALVSLLEEGFCRGALVFPFGRLRGAALVGAVATVAALFATAHFVRGGMRGTASDWNAAWQVWSAVPRAVAQYHEAWVGLFVAGVALYLLAWRQGHAWGAVGAHFGAVVALQVAGRIGDVAPEGGTPFFVDGLLPGYGMAALLVVAIGLGWMIDRRRSRAER